MQVRNLALTGLLAMGPLYSVPASAAKMVCHLYVKAGGRVFGNGTSRCNGIDFSFGRSTSGKFSVIGINKPYSSIRWLKGCSSGTSCTLRVSAYSDVLGEAYIHYDDGGIEYVKASMWYETGH